MAKDNELRNGWTGTRQRARRWPLRAGVLTAAAFALAACAGGGGFSVTKTPAAPLQPVTDVDCRQIVFAGFLICLTDLLERQYADVVLGQINAQAAHDAGYTGAGVRVALIHGNAMHDDLLVEKSYAVTESPLSGNGLNNHADALAGIIAARRNGKYVYGVAYDARLFSIDASGGTGEVFSQGNVASGVLAVSGSQQNTAELTSDIIIVGTNWNVPTSDVLAASLAESARMGKVIVVPAGDANADNPQSPADVASDATLNGQMIVVGAVDENNELAVFGAGASNFASNRAGDQMDFYIVAPGKNIPVLMSSLEDGVSISSGTNKAAAFVSGAAAVLKGAFPHLTAKEIADILRTTATDLGEPGVDAIYGHGLLNLGAAVAPVGELSVPMSEDTGGESAPIETTNVEMSGAFGDALGDETALDSAVALDDYGRAYTVGLSRRVISPKRVLNLGWLLNRFETRRADFPMPKGFALGFAQTEERRQDTPFTRPFAPPSTGTKPTAVVTLGAERGGSSFQFGFGVSPHGYFKAEGEEATPLFLGSGAAQLPHLEFVGTAQGGTFRQSLGKNTDLTLGWFASKTRDERSFADDAPVMSQALLRHRVNEQFTVGVGFSELVEGGTFLGARSSGAFGQTGRTSSNFTTLLGRYDLAADLSLEGSYTRGSTRLAGARTGLLSDWGTIETDAMSLGLIKRDLFSDGDAVGLLISQPLRVSKAEATLNVPVGRDLEGNVERRSKRVSVTPSGRELDLQLAYARPIASGGTVASYILYQHEPGHIESAEPNYGIGVRLAVPF